MEKQRKIWKSYDGRDLDKKQVLVPQMTTLDYARSIGATMENLRTWTTAGVRYWVMFVPVSEDMEEVCKKAFYSELNDYLDEKLGPGRRGRHIVSLDAMLEEGCCPEGTVSSAESIALERILLDEIITELGKKNALYEKIIRLGCQGLSRRDIVEALSVKKSQAYELIRKCHEEVEKWLG